jgi:hypothetical protein
MILDSVGSEMIACPSSEYGRSDTQSLPIRTDGANIGPGAFVPWPDNLFSTLLFNLATPMGLM